MSADLLQPHGETTSADQPPTPPMPPTPPTKSTKLTKSAKTPEATQPDVQPSVAVTGLDVTFGLRPALRAVNFAVSPGTRLALLGPNGAGKTTLLRVLATLQRPTRGTVTIAGYDARHEAQEVRRRLGFVGHQPLLYDELTARENLLFFARMFGVRESAERADALLARVGLRSRANERARNFSRGQAQRLALARGLIHAPAVLLLDEPDTGLDADALTLLEGILEERAQAGQTTILTTHTLERGLAWSDAAVLLVGGRLIHAGASGTLSAGEVRERFAAARERRGKGGRA